MLDVTRLAAERLANALRDAAAAMAERPSFLAAARVVALLGVAQLLVSAVSLVAGLLLGACFAGVAVACGLLW